MKPSPDTGFEVIPHKPSAGKLGVKMGIITALAYVVFLLARYLFFSFNPPALTTSTAVSYLLILGLYALTVGLRKKELGGYAELRDLFSTLFITILITEIVYFAFTYIYLNFIDPEFFKKFQENAIIYIKKSGGGTTKIQHMVSDLKRQQLSVKSIKSTFVALGIWLIIDSIIGLMISLAFRKPEPKY